MTPTKPWRIIPGYSNYQCNMDGMFRMTGIKTPVEVRERLRTKRDAPKRYVVNIQDDRGTSRTLDAEWVMMQTFPEEF